MSCVLYLCKVPYIVLNWTTDYKKQNIFSEQICARQAVKVKTLYELLVLVTNNNTVRFGLWF